MRPIAIFAAILLLTISSQAQAEVGSGYGTIVKGKVKNGRIVGTIQDNTYYSPNRFFKIEVPPAADRGGYIEDHFSPEGTAGVAFFNDTGYFMKAEFDFVPPEVSTMVSQHPEITDEILDAIFFDVMLDQLKSTIHGSSVLHSQKLQLDSGQPALFVVMDLPRAATLTDFKTGLHMDSKRGYLIYFIEGNHLVNISMQDTISLIPSVKEAAKNRLNERLLNHLLHVQKTCTVTKDKK